MHKEVDSICSGYAAGECNSILEFLFQVSSSAPGAARTGDADSAADAWDMYGIAHLDALKVYTAIDVSRIVATVDEHLGDTFHEREQ